MTQMQAIDFIAKKPDFDFDSIRTEWCDERHMRIFWEAVSLITPETEKFIMRAVSAHRRHELVQDNPWLLDTITEFIRQESLHTKVHRELNRALGIDDIPAVKKLEGAMSALYDRLSPLDALAMAAALEHLFFSIIKLTFVDTGFYENRDVDQEVLRVFTWHWCEELEHHSITLCLLAELDTSYEIRLRAAFNTLRDYIPACAQIIIDLEKRYSPAGYRRAAAVDIGRLLGYFRTGLGVSSKFLVPDYDVIRAGEWSWPYIESWRERLGFAAPVKLRGGDGLRPAA